MGLDDLHDLRGRAQRWIDEDVDPATRDELRALLARPDVFSADLADRFSGPLSFGTAGLRGILGAGPNRMNRAVVARATWGLAQELLASVPDAGARGVVVGFDARLMSREFSGDTAAILAAAGLRVVLFVEPVPTPVVAFAAERLRAAAAVVVTASHNPAGYSGYKVYWENAAQIIPPIDTQIAAAIDRAPPSRAVPRLELREARARGLVSDPPADVERAYLGAIRGLSVRTDRADRSLRIVYTPLHGVGDALARRALSQAGFSDVTSVPAQQRPDGAFPTVPFPNPEEPGAMDLALELAREVGADLVLANDPDADRLAIAVRSPSDPGGYCQLTGNQLGVLLGHHLLTADRSGVPANAARPRAVLTSIVSSPWLGRIAASLGVRHEETLTGFKWIANRAIELERAGYEFVFGYEEALGYAIGNVVHDKDGISAALLAAELAATLRGLGRTPLDELDEIARRWGVHASSQISLTLNLTGEASETREAAEASARGERAPSSIVELMDRLRMSPPAHIGGDVVVGVADYQTRLRFRTGSEVAAIALPPSNVLAFELASGARVVARPSGTEPKAKFYFDAWQNRTDRHADEEDSRKVLARLRRIEDAFMAIARG